METGSELSKTVAIFVVQKILLDETGLVSRKKERM
jgi:CCR4-NOT transcription complex subunit 9